MSEGLVRTVALLADAAGPTPPWFLPYREAGRAIAARLGPGVGVADALNAAAPPGLPVRFVPQAALPPGEAYEAFIARTGGVPTRDHPHDLFNGLVWHRFPALKRHLNRLQSAEIAARGIGPVRGPVRDALTLFDENAAWLQAPPVLLQALQARDWPGLFVRNRTAWAEARLTVFGHALMEKLWLSPHKSITAHVWTVPEWRDPERHLLDALTPDSLQSKGHLPLPLAGVPGWCADNEAPAFYDDAAVFRPLRR